MADETERAPRRWLPRWRLRNVGRLLPRAVASFRARADMDHHAVVRLVRAERRGLQLAILCRTVAFAVFGVFYVVAVSVSNGVPSAGGYLLLAAMISMGIAHYIVIGTRHDRLWLKFVTVAADILVVCALVALVPLSTSGDVPQIYVYRSVGIFVLFPFLALVTLSFSPRLVLWAGLVGVIGWWATFAAIVGQMDETVSWSALPVAATREVYEQIVSSPNFIGRGTRMVESLTFFVTSVILALAVARARYIYVAQVHAEEAREREQATRARITQQLGRYVPAAIARRLIDDPSGLAPQVRHGAVLVMDIQGFTAYAARRPPQQVITDLNAFLSTCAEHVSALDGVVISFTGEGLLATFNTPLEVAKPEAVSLMAARKLVGCASDFGFLVRVGLAAGPIAAGSVGSAQRQAFTVYGTTVNRAARLEQLAKELGAEIIVDAQVCRAEPAAMTSLGTHDIRGFQEPVAVWAAASGSAGTGARTPSHEVVGDQLGNVDADEANHAV